LIFLALLWIARELSASLPSMWFWGMNTSRFVPGRWVMFTVAVVACALWYAMARRARSRAVAPSFTVPPALLDLFAGALVGALLLILTDKTWFTGDFLIRGSAEAPTGMGGNFRQSLGLEILFYDRVPHLMDSLGWNGRGLPRLMGAMSGALLTLYLCKLGRELWRSAQIRYAAVIAIVLGGHVVVFTGLGKPTCIMCVLVGATCLYALRAASGSFAALFKLGAVVAGALLLHRSGVFLMLPWLIATVCFARAKRGSPVLRPIVLASILPALIAAIMMPRLLMLFTSFDVPFHLSGLSMTGTPSAWSPGSRFVHALDLLNWGLLMVPCLPLVVFHLLGRRPAPLSSAAVVLASVALPWVIALFVLRPQQGLFRDLDVFAPGAVALSVLCVHVLAKRWEERVGGRTEAVATALYVALASLQILLCFHVAPQGLKRAEAYASESPTRPELERAAVWDFMALRAFSLGEWPLAERACSAAIQLTPSPRLLDMTGLARTYVDDHAGALKAYQMVLAKSPREPIALAGAGGAALRLGQHAFADSMFSIIREFGPNSPERAAIDAVAQRYPVLLARELR